MMIALALLIPLIPGLAIMAVVLRGRARSVGLAEKLALAFVVGWGAHPIIMFLISLAGVPLVFINIVLADLVFSALLLLPFARRLDWAGWRPAGFPPPSAIGLGLLALIGLKAAFVTWSAFIRPALDTDIIRTYALGAKMIFLNKTILLNGPWGDKPLMPFLAQAWTAGASGSWNDSLLALPQPLFFLCFLTIFYAALARYFRRRYALAATALLATVPFLVYQAGTAYTDFTQALYYSLATIYLFLFVKEFGRDREGARSHLLTGALLLGLSIWAKKSGLYYAAIDLAALAPFLWTGRAALSADDRRALWQAALLLPLIAAPWLLFSRCSTFHGYYVELSAQAAVLPGGAAPHSWPVLAALYRNAFFEDNWHLLGMTLLATLAFYPRAAFSGSRRFLLFIIGLHLACLFLLFRFGSYYQYLGNETLLNRLTFHFVPVILYFCAEVIGAGEAGHLSRPGTAD